MFGRNMSKEGKVKGFSIEGWFMQRESISSDALNTELSAIERAEEEHLLALYLLGVSKAAIKQDKRYKIW